MGINPRCRYRLASNPFVLAEKDVSAPRQIEPKLQRSLYLSSVLLVYSILYKGRNITTVDNGYRVYRSKYQYHVKSLAHFIPSLGGNLYMHIYESDMM